jgi:hypothetical protein
MIDGGVQIVIWKRRMYVLVDSKMFLISRQSLKRHLVSAFKGISRLTSLLGLVQLLYNNHGTLGRRGDWLWVQIDSYVTETTASVV